MLRLTLVCLLSLSAAALFVLSAVDYSTLKEHVDVFSLDRDADVSREEFRDVVLRLRFLAGVLAAVSIVLLLVGSRLDRRATTVLSECWGAAKRSPADLRSWVEGETVVYVGALIAVLVTGIALRLAFLDVPMRYDEAATYNAYVSKPLYIGLSNYSAPNNHLFHTFLAKLSVETFGSAPWVVRLPALLAGIAVIPATFGLARILYGRTAALLAAALVATSSTMVEYSTNARGYTLVALFTLSALIAATRVLEHGGAGAWAALGVSGALGLYAVPVMIYALGGVYLWVLLNQMARRRPVRDLIVGLVGSLSLTGVLAVLLYGPVFAAMGVGSVTSNYFVEPQPWWDFLDALPRHTWDTIGTWERDLPTIIVVALAIGLLASLVLTPRISRYPFPPLLAVLVWALPVLAVQRVVPFTRVWLFVVPLVLAASAGFYGWVLGQARGRLPLGELMAVLVLAGGTSLVLSADSVRTSRETGALLDGPAVAEYLRHTLRAGDSVVATGSEAILEYYLQRKGYDASTVIWGEPGRRIVLVVNRLGNQTVDRLMEDIPGRPALSPPRLLREWPSAQVYRVRSSPRG